jgi:hypothetical protein
LPRTGTWKCRFNGDAAIYAADNSNTPAPDVEANGPAQDGMAQSGLFRVGAYSLVVYSQGDPVSQIASDLDGSCLVDGGDVALLLLDMGTTGGPADLDGDGWVTNSDLAFLLMDFGLSCP